MNEIDLNNTYWDRVCGYISELRVDVRWILRQNMTDKPMGSLRIVSHPDLPPGYLRAFFMYVVSMKKRTEEEKIMTIEDYQMEETELEVYSLDDDIKTENQTFENLFKELENMFGVKIFNN
jgi:hypothetical protein